LPMLYWYSTYVGSSSTTSKQACTATRLYETENKFRDQGSKGTNARYILCVNFK
jgi:hypothetical protein